MISTIALLVAVGGGTALAVSHINAARVDGLNAAKLNFERPLTVGPNPKFRKVFDQGGLVIRARCGDLSGFFMDAKAGIASGILSMNRMIGGTLGIAVIGAVFQGAARSRLDGLLAGSGLSAAQRSDIAQGLGGGVSTVPAGVSHAQAAQVTSAAHDAFIGAFAASMRVAAAVTVAGVVVAVTLIRSKREAGPEPGVVAAAATPAAELATGEHAAT